MKVKVGIVDYGIAGNVFSIQRAIEAAGGEVILVKNNDDFSRVDKIVLPGVGSFFDGMQELESLKIVNSIKNFKGKVLGICLGMQVLSKIGYEYGTTEGLGVIEAEVKPVQSTGPVPHVGFNGIKLIKEDLLFEGIEDEQFYFMHSYEVVNYTDVLALTNYCDHQIVAAIKFNNFYGVQFHPEKSRDAGIKLFRNFINI
ncbi:imidazole glycerol phosphate synthase subunit HisH [Vibrio pectenicida]|uniref:Imidazole glycerol phosphate synthase subunit HisH n=1 Tax=Vibrio pectenicida TaxID=62763 RepID=A0A7Y4ED55_9VIBR|nr:imidazole glycerol phosphate synthase subunit HisH [Vibrio pectenicida]NOH70309.1 imidazole glycerol phosphate synthase subunit HisH [Vibrio pectenicida]